MELVKAPFYLGGNLMDKKMGIKELYDVTLRLNDPLDIGDKHYDINEIILSFEKAEIAQIKQETESIAARGGFHNQVLMYWDIDDDMEFSISHGVLSPTSWALLSNSKIN
ncbi:MAG: hypothetical protein LUC37_00955 [Prevotella sp.]|nr:hypothetical protein [Prevotella sp.]